MRVVFRADASSTLGAGHIMRCLALASELKHRGAEVVFICQEAPGNLITQIQAQDLATIALPVQGDDQDVVQTLPHLQRLQPDWLVVDHYQFGASWEKSMRGLVGRILAIDDTAETQHDCDLLLNQNLRTHNPYGALVPPGAQILLGPGYALLRDEFANTTTKARSGVVQRILIFFGASDPTQETIKALQAFEQLNMPEIGLDVVVGSGNPQAEYLSALCAKRANVRFHCQVDNMAEIMTQADLALGAAGVTSWERLAVGLPALVVAVADNQMENMQQLQEQGVAVALGKSEEVTAGSMQRMISELLKAPQRIHSMSQKALGMVDGKGAQRVADIMFKSIS